MEAILDVEAALAGAQADAGDIPLGAAGGIARACDVARIDVDAVVDEAAGGGNLVIPLLPRLQAIVGPDDAGYVHRAATSQDILDAARRRCRAALRRCRQQPAAPRLARRHRPRGHGR